MDTSLTVILLGNLSSHSVRLPNAPPITRFRTQKTAALFAFLAFRSGTPQPREELIATFWPDADIDAGRASLRTALASLRKEYGGYLQTDKTSVLLTVSTDVQRFHLAMRNARNSHISKPQRVEHLREAVEAYGGDLLPGFYEEWALQERERLATEYRAALSALARWHMGLGELAAAQDYAQRAAVSDPLSEEIRADLIRLLKKRNHPAAARRQFDDLERLLQEQLGVKPSPALYALVTDISKQPQEEASEPVQIVQLPISRGRFRGRKDSLMTLIQRLAAGKQDAEGTRLFTLFGPGGIGKTWLAIEGARRLATHGLVEAVWFVPLAEAASVEQIWESLMAALEITTSIGVSAGTRIANHLTAFPTCLLVLDNLEQVSLEAGEIAQELLSRTPALTILTTSRRRLGIPGEELIAVKPLLEDDAISLFLDRARSVEPDFTPSETDLETLRTLTTRLEGFPLAIELAAAWIAVLHPAEMLTQLEQGLLNLPARTTGEERHLSLTATIRWSVALLSPGMQQTFFSLSVFRGGWDTPAAIAICGVERETLASLRDRSLITTQSQGEGMRFRMHESLREYGAASLAPLDRTALVQKHTAFYTTLVEQNPQRDLTQEHSNLRAAFAAADADHQHRLALALIPFWDKQGHWREGREALEQVLTDQKQTLSVSERAPLLYAAGRYCYNLCDFVVSQTYHEAALKHNQSLGEERGIGRGALALAGLAFHAQSDLIRSRTLTEQALTHFERAGDAAGQVTALLGLGVLTFAVRDFTTARTFQARALEVAEKAGLEHEQALAHHRLGMTSTRLEDLEDADSHFQQAEKRYHAHQELVDLAYLRCDQGQLAQTRGDLSSAQSYYEEALKVLRSLGEHWASAICLGNLARIAAESDVYEDAVIHWMESLHLRVRLQDKALIVTALDEIGTLLFQLAAVHSNLDAGCAAVLLRTASARLRAELGLGVSEQESPTEAEMQIRSLLGAERCLQREQESAALSQEKLVAIALEHLSHFRNQ